MVMKEKPKKRPNVPPTLATREKRGMISCSFSTKVWSEAGQSWSRKCWLLHDRNCFSLTYMLNVKMMLLNTNQSIFLITTRLLTASPVLNLK